MEGARAGVELHAHSEDRHCAGLGNHALGHLLLHEQNCQCGRGEALQNVFQDGTGDVEGEVGDYFIGNGCGGRARPVWLVCRKEVCGIEFQYVTVDEGDVGFAGELCAQNWDQPLIQFDGNDAAGLFGKVMGQRAEAGTDLQYGVGFLEVSGGGDTGQMRGVDE